jgi:hypothetical protein
MAELMNVSKGLVIDEPWIGCILSGQKDWEMRSGATAFRGWFGLIRKGSGMVVGVARLVGVEAPKSADEMIASIERHRIPEAKIRDGSVAKWTTPWVIADVRHLRQPVPYKHPNGAVKWVQLEPKVVEAITRQLAGSEEIHAETLPLIVPLQPARPERTAGPASTNLPETRFIGETEITGGNLKNNHFYLRSFIQRFPDDLIGGGNKATAAKRTCLVDWGGNSPQDTDIAGDKMLFRRRAWVGRFFADNGAKEGDRVQVVETAPYQYRVTVIPT